MTQGIITSGNTTIQSLGQIGPITTQRGSRGVNWESSSGVGFDDPIPKYFELELIDNTRVLIKFRSLELDVITNIKQTSTVAYKFDWVFPFFHKTQNTFSSFTLKSIGHDQVTYDVKCPLTVLTKIFGIQFQTYEELLLTDAIENG